MRTIWLWIGAILLTLAAPAAGQKVSVDFDWEKDFSAYKTYAWLTGTPASSELTQKRIESAVDAQLEAKGLRPVEDDADLYVMTRAASDRQTKRRMVDVGIGMSRRTSSGSVSVGGSTGGRTRTVTVGTLVIDLVDGSVDELVWQAVANDTVSGDPEKLAKQIETAVQKAFESVPPPQE